MTADPKVSPRPWIWGDARCDTANGGWYLCAADPESNDEVGGLYSGPVGRRMSDPSEGKVLSPYGWECEGIMASALDRAHIVRCVNAHDGLVEALELILHSFDDGPPSMQAVRLDDACKNAQAVLAALAAAKEGA